MTKPAPRTSSSARQSAATAGSALGDLLDQRLIVCLGNGGVGKTTAAAALAWAAALRHPTAVITVDPARRLKDALGLGELSVEPRPVPIEGRRAQLDALALDTKRTFDALIERVAPSADIAAAIRANRLYQELSNELGGSTEYMAMEKLYDLLHRQSYATVVVDTPPSTHARDLLSAPLRMTALLASSAVRILKTPASLLWGSDTRLGRLTMKVLLGALERFTGMHLLSDLSDFAANFEQLVDGFRNRAEDVDRALRRPDSSFILVTTPEPETIAETIAFDRELREEGFPVAGVIANRVHDFPPLDGSAGRGIPEPLRQKLCANYEDFAALAVREAIALARLEEATGAPLLAVLPALEQAPSSLAGLALLARRLDGGARRKRG